jgi:hypothetical protein
VEYNDKIIEYIDVNGTEMEVPVYYKGWERFYYSAWGEMLPISSEGITYNPQWSLQPPSPVVEIKWNTTNNTNDPTLTNLGAANIIAQWISHKN